MSESPDLYCKIFTNGTNLNSLKEFLSNLFQGIIEMNSMTLDHLIIEVHNNPDRKEAPRGDENFLHWPVLVEIDAEGTSDEQTLIEECSKLLKRLWSSGIDSVAACDFEESLPQHGGISRYRSN